MDHTAPRRLARLGLVLGCLAALLAPTGVLAEPAAESSPAQLDALVAVARDEGTVRVLAELRAGFRPEGRLGAEQARAQRAEIRGRARALLEELEDHDVTVLHAYEAVPYLALALSERALEALADSRHVAGIHTDEPMQAQLAGSGPLVEADQLHEAGLLGSPYTVAVLDSGVETSHPFLRGRIIEEACYSNTVGDAHRTSLCPNGRSVQTGRGAGEACTIAGCWHGTHVAGIAAGARTSASSPPATFDGMAPAARIMSVQVFHRLDSGCPRNAPAPCTSAHSSDIVAGLERVYALRDRHLFAAVNLSLSTSVRYTGACDNHPTKRVIDNLRSVGIPTVVASGNHGWSDAVGAPGCVSSAITVGSTTREDQVSWFSNGHPTMVDLLAPGSSITSSMPGGGYQVQHGTSMAAPHVSGAWALLRAHSPDASFTQILRALRAHGAPVTDDRGRTSFDLPRIRGAKAAFEGLGPPAGCYPQPFTDVRGDHPFCSEIAWMVGEGITAGFSDGTFRPLGEVSRQAMAAFLHRLAGSPPVPSGAPRFSDVPRDHPFFTEISWLAASDVTGGYADGTFRPAEPVRRQAMAAFLHRLADSPESSMSTLRDLVDVDERHAFASEIAWMVESGVSTGYADATFRPAASVRRQSMAAFLERYTER